MAYVFRSFCRSAKPAGGHWVKTRWRDDDHWGGLWRSLFDLLCTIFPEAEKGEVERHVCHIEVDITYMPEKTAALLPLFEQAKIGQELAPGRLKKGDPACLKKRKGRPRKNAT